MELCNATVRLNGSVGHTVEKVGLTPPEIAVLRAIHGEDAVVNIQPTRMDKRSHKVERDRLEKLYDPKLIANLFPGVAAQLPVSLKDIGLGPSPTPQAAPAVLDEMPEPSEDDLKAMGLDGGDGNEGGDAQPQAA